MMSDNNMQNMGGGNKCPCPHHKVVPVAVFLIGLFGLLSYFQIISMNGFSIAWPILLMIIGLMKIFKNKCRCC